jgi:hypothetical protein
MGIKKRILRVLHVKLLKLLVNFSFFFFSIIQVHKYIKFLHIFYIIKLSIISNRRFHLVKNFISYNSISISHSANKWYNFFTIIKVTSF